MTMIYYSMGVAILIMGLIRGVARPRTRSAPQVASSALFWASAAGLLGVVTSVVAVIGITAVFDERTDSVNGFDHLLTMSQFFVLGCTAIAVAAHIVVFSGSKQDAEQDVRQVSSEAAPSAPPDEPST